MPAFIYNLHAYQPHPSTGEDWYGWGIPCMPTPFPTPALAPRFKPVYHPHPASPRLNSPRLRRSYTMDERHTFDVPQREPWEHMTQTYAWVLDQSFADMAQKNDETVQRVMLLQHRNVLRAVSAAREATQRTMEFVRGIASQSQPNLDDLDEMYSYGRRPRQTRQHRDAEWAVQEELRRLQEAQRNTERCRRAYERRKAEDEEKERRRQEALQKARARRGEAEKQAWGAYEDRWAAIATSSDPLTFREIPWPTFGQAPEMVEDITASRVALFVLSLSHSQGQSRKERIKTALRRWHPDRFGRVLARVGEDDKARVEEGAGVVVRCLNNLLERDDDKA